MFVSKKNKMVLTENEKIQFLFQSSMMLSQKVSISKALEILIKTQKSKKLVLLCKNLTMYIKQGYSLTDSAKKILNLPPFFSSILESGERTGHLGQYLLESYRYYKTRNDNKKKQQSQAFYPSFVFIATSSMSIALMCFAIPSMVQLSESLNLTLPDATLSMIALFSWLRSYWYWVLVGTVVFALLVYLTIRKFRYCFDWLSMKIPFFRSRIVRREIVSMLTLFSMLLKDQVPIEHSLEYAVETIQNQAFKDELSYTLQSIQQGQMDFEKWNHSFGKDIYLLSFLKSSINTKQLIENTDFFITIMKQEMEEKRKKMTRLIEPFSLGLIGVIVLLVITKVYLPVFEMFSTMDWMSGF